MKVYVAGAWVEREKRAIPVIKQLREAGIIITHDWTGDENQVSSAADSDSKLSKEYRLEHSKKDKLGVTSANAVLLLAPSERGASGAWAEFGIALGSKIPVYVAGGIMNRTIFTELAERNFATDQEGVDHLIMLSQKSPNHTFPKGLKTTRIKDRIEALGETIYTLDLVDEALWHLENLAKAASTTLESYGANVYSEAKELKSATDAYNKWVNGGDYDYFG